MTSATQLDKAGRILRDYQAGASLLDPADVARARNVIREYRGAHSYPLTKVSVSLRQFIATEERRANRSLRIGHPAQRLKRLDAIAAKLVRESTRLTQMQDVAGCRAVLHDQDAVERVAARIRRNWDIEDFDDYLANPKEDGYRALHLQVRKDGFRVEIQLRTDLAHAWAELVDTLTLSLAPAHDVKHGQAPADLLAILRQLADSLREVETDPAARGPALRSELAAMLAQLREIAVAIVRDKR
jgi:ppGpp synthetase/RelA/SpoT-type nucleotidyltranferase